MLTFGALRSLAMAILSSSTAQVVVAAGIMAGEFGERDPARAIRWARRAAGRRNAPGQVLLGNFLVARNEPGDREEAPRWYRAAADPGFIPGLISLGARFEHREGVVRDLDEAMRLYAAAGQRGDPGAADYLLTLTQRRATASKVIVPSRF